MSITQEQYDAIKPGDRVTIGGWGGEVIGRNSDGEVWVSTSGSIAHPFDLAAITAIIPPAPVPVAWVNLDADGCSDWFSSRDRADVGAYGDRTHVITIYADGTTTTEAVS